MPRLPSWYPASGEPKPAPMPLLRVQAFVNTWDAEAGVDLLAEGEAARAWLIDAGLLPAPAALTTADLSLACGVREGLRGLLLASAGGEGGGPGLPTDPDGHPAGLEPLREVADRRRLRLAVQDDGVLSLSPCDDADLVDGLLDLLLVVRGAQADGTWWRLKACANPACVWAFYDRSRNRQGSWCEMSVCGNRLKNRAFRDRRRPAR